MPGPHLDLPEAVEETLFGFLVDVLKDDTSAFAGAIRTWEVLDGSSATLQPPSTGAMPWCRLMPGPSSMEIIEAAAYQIDMSIYVTLATEGLHRADQFNLWGVLRHALRFDRPYATSTVFEQFRLLGAIEYQLSTPGFGPYPMPSPTNPSPAQDLFGTARILIKFRVGL